MVLLSEFALLQGVLDGRRSVDNKIVAWAMALRQHGRYSSVVLLTNDLNMRTIGASHSVPSRGARFVKMHLGALPMESLCDGGISEIFSMPVTEA